MHERLNTEESARPLNSTRSKTHIVNDDIKTQIEQEDKTESKMTEKITASKLVIFVVYVVCLINSALTMQNIEETSNNNISIQESCTNRIDTGTGFQAIDAKKITFDEIDTIDEVHDWFKNVLLNSFYSSDLSYQSYEYVPKGDSVLYFQIMSPIRLLLNRAVHVDTPKDPVYPHKWKSGGESLDTNPYGEYYIFEYNEQEGGYMDFFPITYMDKESVIYSYNELVYYNFFDEYLKELKVDVVVFNKVNNYWAFVQARFEFSAAGTMSDRKLKVFSYPSDAYYPLTGAEERLGTYQVLFLIMFCYYFFQEFLKMYIQIKNTLLTNKPSGKVSVEEAAKMAKKKFEAVLKGILNHVKDPLTFVNVLSISFSFYLIYEWLDYRYNSMLLPNLKKLEMENGIITGEITEEKKNIFIGFNNLVEKESQKLQNIYQIASLNIAILMTKGLSYISYLFEPVSTFQKIIGMVRDKLFPLLVMVLTFLFSFSVFVYFYFGPRIPEFSEGLIAIIIFFINIINQYFYNVDIMYKISPSMTLIFVVFFIIFANFILISIFLISSIHTYEEFMQKKKEKIKKKEAQRAGPKPHIIWKIKKFFQKDIKMIYFSIFNRLKGTKLRLEFEKDDKKLKRDMSSYVNFPYDISIEHEEKNSSGNYRFRNEITNFKVARTKKTQMVRLCWKVIGSFFMIFLFIIVSLEHHEITEGRSMIRSAAHSFDQVSVIYINEMGRKTTVVSNRTLDDIKSFQDFVDWMNLFQSFGLEKNISLSSGEEIQGFFFGGVNFLLTEKYRITVRKASIIENDPPYDELSLYTFTETFLPLDENPTGEATETVFGYSGREYNYLKDESYMNAGGYVFYSEIDRIVETIQDAVDDALLDSAVVSFVIDFPIYQPTTMNALYGRILVELDDSFNFLVETTIDLIPLNYYNTSNQRFIAFIEICILLSFFVLAYRLFWILKNKYNHYNLWYSLHIAYFPEIMIETRNKSQPEFLRILKYLFKFNETTSFIFLVLIWICAIIWIIYLVAKDKVLGEVALFMNKDPDAHIPSLTNAIVDAMEISSISKVFEALLIGILSIKIIYYYSFFKNFKYLTTTIGRSVPNSLTVLVILFFYLLAFSLFLHINMSMKFDSYSNILDIVCMLLQMISGLFARAHHQLFLENDFKVLTLVFFYIPYIFIVIFLVSYMFLSVQMYYHNQVQDELSKHDELEIKISPKEFVMLTYGLICPKKRKVKLSFQISDQTIYDIRLYEVFDEFRETIEMKEKFKNMEMWAYNCAKSIYSEYQRRKKVKKLNKEIMQAVMAHEMAEGEDLTKMNSNQRLHEDKLRLKYWDYFRTSNTSLLEFMQEFSAINHEFERMTTNQSFLRKKRQSEYKIKKYIIYLEKMYEKNMMQIRTLSGMIEAFNKRSFIGGEQYNSVTFQIPKSNDNL